MSKNFQQFIPFSFTESFLFMQLVLKIFSGMANGVDPDQTVPGAVWSGSALFACAIFLMKFQDIYNVILKYYNATKPWFLSTYFCKGKCHYCGDIQQNISCGYSGLASSRQFQ